MDPTELKWKNCTSCHFPTQCRQVDVPAQGCFKANTLWLCPICYHTDIADGWRDPSRLLLSEYERSNVGRYQVMLARRNLAWGLNLLCGLAVSDERLWSILESREKRIERQAEEDARNE